MKREALPTERGTRSSTEQSTAQSNEEADPRRFQSLIWDYARKCQGDKGRIPADQDRTGHLRGRGRGQGLHSARLRFQSPREGLAKSFQARLGLGRC